MREDMVYAVIESTELVRRVDEVERWCQPRLTSGSDVSTRFRSESLRPSDVTLRGAYLRGLSREEITAARVRSVENLVDRRRKLLSASPGSAAAVGARGRGAVLAFDPEACFFDGVVRAETENFFDENDLPPWDTWIFYGAVDNIDPVLLSWIPEPCMSWADRAVAVHMCNAYRWLPRAG